MGCASARAADNSVGLRQPPVGTISGEGGAGNTGALGEAVEGKVVSSHLCSFLALTIVPMP